MDGGSNRGSRGAEEAQVFQSIVKRETFVCVCARVHVLGTSDDSGDAESCKHRFCVKTILLQTNTHFLLSEHAIVVTARN